jgi:uncharacterized protein involved in exopolysaccharide biosynthesis
MQMQHSQDQSAPRHPHVPQGYPLVPQDPAGHGGGESAELFDWALIGCYAMFVLRSIRRHKLLFLLVWFAIIAFSLALMVSLPKTYQVQTTLQAQRNIMPALGNPTRTMDADAPTRMAAETVQRYDNLVAVIQQTELIKRWPLNRAPLLQVKDFIWRTLFRPPTPEERIDNFVNYLRDRLWVRTGEGTVTIGIEFPDKELAYRIVDTALQNFLEARHAADVSTIAEAITILEGRADLAHQTLVSALQQLQALRDARAPKGKRVNKSVVASRAPAPLDAETSRLVVTLQSKRRAIAELEEFRRRRVTELQTKLQEQRAGYSDTHPMVLDTEQSLEALRQDSPQVAALKRELEPLQAELRKKGLADDAAKEPGQPTPVMIPAEHLDPIDPLVDEGPQIESAKGQVRFALTNYNQFLDRLEGARLELDAARAAFKYRYLLIIPAQRPRAPIKPNPGLVLAASLIAGLALAVLSTTLVDLHSRKLLENWQVERQLRLPLFGEMQSA